MKKLDKKYKTNLSNNNPLNILSSKAYKMFAAQSSDFKPGTQDPISSTMKLDY